jgi:hypothetical protein
VSLSRWLRGIVQIRDIVDRCVRIDFPPLSVFTHISLVVACFGSITICKIVEDGPIPSATLYRYLLIVRKHDSQSCNQSAILCSDTMPGWISSEILGLSSQ